MKWYNLEQFKDAIKGRFEIKQLKVDTGTMNVFRTELFITNRRDLKSVYRSDASDSGYMGVLADGNSVGLSCSEISPIINISDKYLERTNMLESWVAYNEIDVSNVEFVNDEPSVKHAISYPGICDYTYGIHGDLIPIESRTLELKPHEIDNIVNSIDDKLLKHKVYKVLTQCKQS